MEARKIRVLYETVQGFDILFDGQQMREDDKIMEFIECIPEFEELCNYTQDLRVAASAETPEAMRKHIPEGQDDLAFYQGPLTNGATIASHNVYFVLMEMWRCHNKINEGDYSWALSDREEHVIRIFGDTDE